MININPCTNNVSFGNKYELASTINNVRHLEQSEDLFDCFVGSLKKNVSSKDSSKKECVISFLKCIGFDIEKISINDCIDGIVFVHNDQITVNKALLKNKRNDNLKKIKNFIENKINLEIPKAVKTRIKEKIKLRFEEEIKDTKNTNEQDIKDIKKKITQEVLKTKEEIKKEVTQAKELEKKLYVDTLESAKEFLPDKLQKGEIMEKSYLLTGKEVAVWRNLQEIKNLINETVQDEKNCTLYTNLLSIVQNNIPPAEEFLVLRGTQNSKKLEFSNYRLFKTFEDFNSYINDPRYCRQNAEIPYSI